jgi:hypothetical protein
MSRHHLINGKQVPFTLEEERARDLEEKAFAQKQAYYEANLSYKDQRKSAYPPIGEQLDMLWHAMNEGKIPRDNSFYESLKAIKEEFPKPI